MNGGDTEGNTEYLSLKSLLQQWKLTHLLQHLMAQNINVEILKMMKTQHISELLQNFTCGDRIRFEYELEKWRYSIGNPLQNAREMHMMPMPMIMPTTMSNGIASHNLRQQNLSKDCETQTIAKDSYSSQAIQNSISTHEAFFNFQPQQPTNTPSSPPPPQPLQSQSKETTSTFTSSKQIYSPRVRVSSPSITRDPHARGRPSADFLAQQMAMRLDAREILEKCSPRGPELMRLYETNKRFRPVERVELINLFAHYFYEHSIHLPVKLSYELERQILKLFPGERLKDYRTEKRGKIYIRLSNIKNNRRRAREAKIAFLRDLEQAEQKDSDDDASKNVRSDDLAAEDTEMMEEDNSNSLDKPLKIYFGDVKQETAEDIEF